MNTVFISFPPFNFSCVYPLKLLKFMVSYSITVTHTRIYTLIICLVDFSAACMYMCLGPTAWYWSFVIGLEPPLWSLGPVVITALFFPQPTGVPSAFAPSSYCFLLQECFPASVTWWLPTVLRHSPCRTLLSLVPSLCCQSIHSLSFLNWMFFSTGLWTLPKEEPFLSSPCSCVWSAPDSKQVYSDSTLE